MNDQAQPSGSVATEPIPAIVAIDARQSLGPAELDDLFPEGAAFRRSLVTFTVLLALAAVIASFGLYQDSVASIIGAMVVAPLGGAMMALAGALVTGRNRWQAISFLEVALGALMVIAIGWLVSAGMPDPLEINPAIDARTEPGILDLGVALAAGAAGAYVAARRTGSDALPGVAIAVSLVPPLATIGICIELGRLDDAAGALLLFLTNFASIVVVACVVFMFFGALPTRDMLRRQHRLRNGFILAVVGLVAVSIPLVLVGVDRAIAIVRSTAGAPIVREWIGERDLEVTSWSLDGDVLRLDLAGPVPPADPQELAAALAAEFGTEMTVDVTYTARERVSVSAAP